MQTAFFQLNAFLPEEQRQQLLNESVQAAYAKKGEQVVAANLNAIAKTADALPTSGRAAGMDGTA